MKRSAFLKGIFFILLFQACTMNHCLAYENEATGEEGPANGADGGGGGGGASYTDWAVPGSTNGGMNMICRDYPQNGGSAGAGAGSVSIGGSFGGNGGGGGIGGNGPSGGSGGVNSNPSVSGVRTLAGGTISSLPPTVAQAFYANYNFTYSRDNLPTASNALREGMVSQVPIADSANHARFGDPVSTAIGNYEGTVVDFHHARAGFPFEFKRSYSVANDNISLSMPFGWTNNFDSYLYVVAANDPRFPNSTKSFFAYQFTPEGTKVFSSAGISQTGPTPLQADPGNFSKFDRIQYSDMPTGPNVPGVDAFLAGATITDKFGTVTYYAAFSPGDPNTYRPYFSIDSFGNQIDYYWDNYIRSEKIIYNPGVASFWYPCAADPPGTPVQPPIYYWEDNGLGNPPVQRSVIPTLNSRASCQVPIYHTYGYAQDFWDLRLSEVKCNKWNWNIKFGYNNDRFVTTSDGYIVNVGLLSVGTALIRSVTSSEGDVITFETPAAEKARGQDTVPIGLFDVTRLPGNNNGSYRVTGFPNTNSTTTGGYNYYLAKLDDPNAPAGGRHLQFDFSNNGYFNYISKVYNGRGQLAYQLAVPFNPAVPYVSTLKSASGQVLQEDLYTNTSLGPQLDSSTKYFDGTSSTEYFNSYDANQLLTKYVDGKNHEIDCLYDGLGNLSYKKTMQDGVAVEQHFGFDGFSRLTTYSDGRGKTTQISNFDRFTPNKRIIIQDTGNLARTTVIDYANGLPTAIHLPLLHPGPDRIISIGYDGNGNLASIQEPDLASIGRTGTRWEYTFDSKGLLNNKKTIGPGGTSLSIGYHWNNLNQLTEIDYPGGSAEHFDLYDLDGNLVTRKDSNLNQTKTDYDLDDNLVDEYDAYLSGSDQLEKIYGYDERSNRISITDGNSKITTITPNEQNLVHSIQDASGKKIVYTYDNAFNLATKVDDRPVTTTYDYYENNLLKQISFSDGTGSIGFKYDLSQNLATLSDDEGTKTYDFDGLGELKSLICSPASGHQAYSLVYGYDPGGNRNTLLLYSGAGSAIPTQTFTYGILENNLVSSVRDIDGDQTNYIYDELDRLRTVIYPNNVAQAVYGYDPSTSLLASVSNEDFLGTTLTSASYGRYPDGSISSLREATGVTSYTYDHALRLKNITNQLGSIDLLYDFASNLKSKSLNAVIQNALNYDDSNELLNDTTHDSFPYDGAGNLRGEYHLGVGKSFVWDGQNRLTGVFNVAGAGASPLANFQYDGNNLRIRKTDGSSNITNYIYDGSRVLVEVDGSGAAKKIYNPGISVTDDGGNKFYMLQNGHGDVANLIDRDGNLVQSYQYDPFGNMIGGLKDFNNMRYVGVGGVYSDDDLGLQYMWNRWYDPQLGRFISRDPLGLGSDGLNLYAYAKDNPLGFIDPFGLCAEKLTTAQTLGSGAIDWHRDPGLLASNLVALTTVMSVVGVFLGMPSEGLVPEQEAEVEASTVAGMSRSPLLVQPGTNLPATINGIDYSGHALDQMQGRGFMPSVVENTLQVGTPFPGNLPGTGGLYDAVNNISVIRNLSTGNIITVRNGAP